MVEEDRGGCSSIVFSFLRGEQGGEGRRWGGAKDGSRGGGRGGRRWAGEGECFAVVGVLLLLCGYRAERDQYGICYFVLHMKTPLPPPWTLAGREREDAERGMRGSSASVDEARLYCETRYKIPHSRCTELQDSTLSVPLAPSDVCKSQPELSKWLAPSVSDCIQ
eukprot:1491357-Rhodomonas_salina.1